MATRTRYYALPFQKFGDLPKAAIDHLIECASEAEAISRAEQMSTYPEYGGAVAAVLRKRGGAPYGPPVLIASFGILGPKLAEIFKALD